MGNKIVKFYSEVKKWQLLLCYFSCNFGFIKCGEFLGGLSDDQLLEDDDAHRLRLIFHKH
jgi:hypothetical protein